MAKCYFAKHKLVWEILEGGLKSKIEIQWSDITALKANCPDNGPSSLTVVVIYFLVFYVSYFKHSVLFDSLVSFCVLQLARQPLFFRETNPQPRKHTLWQATSDFTDGQASKHRYICFHRYHLICICGLKYYALIQIEKYYGFIDFS